MLSQIKIECFLSLARTLNFTETAREVYLTQQAISNNIASLEKDLGFPLFIRNSRSVALTKDGIRCLEMFCQMQSIYFSTVSELRSQHQQADSVLRIGYQEWLDYGPEPHRAMTAIQREIPGFRLSGERFPPSVLRDRLVNGQLDLALMYKSFYESLNLPGRELRSLDLLDTPLVIVVSSDHPKITARATYETFIREPLLFDVWGNESVEESNRRAKAIIFRWKLTPKRVINVPNRDSGYTAAELGEGIVASSELNRICDRSTLKKYPVLGSFETLVCIWHADVNKPFLEQFVNQLQQQYSQRAQPYKNELL